MIIGLVESAEHLVYVFDDDIDELEVNFDVAPAPGFVEIADGEIQSLLPEVHAHWNGHQKTCKKSHN